MQHYCTITVLSCNHGISSFRRPVRRGGRYRVCSLHPPFPPNLAKLKFLLKKFKNMLQASGLFGMRVIITEDTTFVECVGSHDV